MLIIQAHVNETITVGDSVLFITAVYPDIVNMRYSQGDQTMLFSKTIGGRMFLTDNAIVEVLDIYKGRTGLYLRLGFTAPRSVRIKRNTAADAPPEVSENITLTALTDAELIVHAEARANTVLERELISRLSVYV